MVGMNKEAIAQKISEDKIIDIPQEELNWGSVSLSEVLNSDTRLEASVYNIEGRHAREILKKCKWELSSVCGDNGLATAYHRPRFKRIWVEKSPFPIYQPSQILEIYPKPSGYISEATKTDIEALRVKKGQILLTCSGTIGNCSIVSKTLDNKIFSHDLIRIDCKDEMDIGYVYAFLKTKIGYTLINTNNYGAVVSHIEPEHLNNIPIPNPPSMLKKRIHELIMQSYELRDESNELLDKAEELLINELELPPIDDFKLDYFDKFSELKNYTVRLSELQERFDASYHVPIVKAIVDHLKKHALEVTTLGDSRISKKVILPGRFKRVYVEEGQGIKFLGGREIFELNPSTNKFLSVRYHKRKIEKELSIKANSILTTSRGTLGKVVLAPKHFEGWAISDNLIQIIPSSTELVGYIYVFLNSDYGYELINRFTYGAVVDALEPAHILQVQVPILKNKTVQQTINEIALEANDKRYKAYKLEQKAIAMVNDEVIHKY
jgi:type I restriction enzyme S subunit